MELFGNDGFQVNLIQTGSEIENGTIELNTNDQNFKINKTIPIYNKDWYNVYLKRINDNIELGLKRQKNGILYNNISSSSTIISQNNFNSSSVTGNSIEFANTYSGSIQELRIWTTGLSGSELEHHAFDFNSIATENPYRIDNHLIGQYKLNDNHDLSDKTYVNDYNRNEKYDLQAINFDNNSFKNITIQSNKTLLENNGLLSATDSNISIGKTSGSSISYKDSNKIDVMFSPAKYINKDILSEFAMFNFNNAFGNPLDKYKSNYQTLDDWRHYYYEKFNDTYNYYAYIKFIRNFDKTVFKIIKSVLPERVKLNSGILIKPTILERNKFEWNKPKGIRYNYKSNIDTKDYYKNESILEKEKISQKNIADEIKFISEQKNLETDVGRKIDSINANQYDLQAQYFYEGGPYEGEMEIKYIDKTDNQLAQLDIATYKGSKNTSKTDLQQAPVIVSQSAGTRIYVE